MGVSCAMLLLLQVRRQSEIWHRNVVTLIGYCQDGGLQMLVFEHLPNGSVCGHLYGSNLHSSISVRPIPTSKQPKADATSIYQIPAKSR